MLSLVMPFYNNAALVHRHLSQRADYPQRLLDETELILVDDCSDPAPKLDELPRNTAIYRVTTSLDWNQSGARNLGAVVARHDWLLLTDIDHFFTTEDLSTLLDELPTLDRDVAYDFRRMSEDGSERDPHPNTWLLRREAFIELGGADEDFAGHYGHEDLIFNWRWAQSARFTRRHPSVSVMVERDGATPGLERDHERNAQLMDAKIERRELFAPGPMLRFDWTVVADNRPALRSPAWREIGTRARVASRSALRFGRRARAKMRRWRDRQAQPDQAG